CPAALANRGQHEANRSTALWGGAGCIRRRLLAIGDVSIPVLRLLRARRARAGARAEDLGGGSHLRLAASPHCESADDRAPYEMRCPVARALEVVPRRCVPCRTLLADNHHCDVERCSALELAADRSAAERQVGGDLVCVGEAHDLFTSCHSDEA